MKNSPTRGAELPAIDFIPYDIEAKEVTYVDWLLAGGAPISELHVRAWEPTQPGGLEAI